MAGKFDLMQRGTFQTPTDPTSLFGPKGLIEGDYMGSTEFEVGSIPGAYAYMMHDFKEYDLFPTQVKHRNGFDTLLVWCIRERHEEIIEALEFYCANPYRLQEWTRLPEATKPLSEWELARAKRDKKEGYKPRETDFWWEIQRRWNFMCFFSGEKRRSSFLDMIHNCHKNWWLALSEEERDERLKRAAKNPFINR